MQVCVAAVAGISPQDIEEPDAKAAFIWILGQFGAGIQVRLLVSSCGTVVASRVVYRQRSLCGVACMCACQLSHTGLQRLGVRPQQQP